MSLGRSSPCPGAGPCIAGSTGSRASVTAGRGRTASGAAVPGARSTSALAVAATARYRSHISADSQGAADRRDGGELHGEGDLAWILRLVEMGRLAAGLAHEVSQPLAAVANLLEASAVRLRRQAPCRRSPRSRGTGDLAIRSCEPNRRPRRTAAARVVNGSWRPATSVISSPAPRISCDRSCDNTGSRCSSSTITHHAKAASVASRSSRSSSTSCRTPSTPSCSASIGAARSSWKPGSCRAISSGCE